MEFSNKPSKFIISEYLSYKDIGQPFESHINHEKYAKALLEIAEIYGDEIITNTISEIRKTFDRVIEKLGVDDICSKTSKSLTWIIWDVSKQYYMYKNPEASNSDYYDNTNPLTSSDKQTEIINRQLGFEIFHNDRNFIFLNGLNTLTMPSLNKGEILSLIEGLIQQNSGRYNYLSSYQYAIIGKAITDHIMDGRINILQDWFILGEKEKAWKEKMGWKAHFDDLQKKFEPFYKLFDKKKDNENEGEE